MKRSTRTDKGLGQNGLYWQMLRKVAVQQSPKAAAREIQALMRVQNKFYEAMYNDHKPSKELSVAAFHVFFNLCQKASIEMFGVSGMEEDSRPFDHGSKT